MKNKCIGYKLSYSWRVTLFFLQTLAHTRDLRINTWIRLFTRAVWISRNGWKRWRKTPRDQPRSKIYCLVALYFPDLWLLKFTTVNTEQLRRERKSFLKVLDLAREFIECTDPIVHVCHGNLCGSQVDFSVYIRRTMSTPHKASGSRRCCKTVFLRSSFLYLSMHVHLQRPC